MIGATLLLLSVFILGAGIGYRVSILILHNFIRELDEEQAKQRLKELTGYKREQN